MKSFADPVRPAKQLVPVNNQFPHMPEQGEMFFYDCFGQIGASGLYIYVNDVWVALYSVENNIWERYLARPLQQIFDTKTVYRTDGKSVVVYVNGKRVPPTDYAEVSAQMITFKYDPEGDEALKAGDVVEFQFFNVRKNTSFDVKAWNRKN